MILSYSYIACIKLILINVHLWRGHHQSSLFFTASCKVWATQGTLSQPSSLDATVMLLALSCTIATMRPSEISYSTHVYLREMAMFSPVCFLDISFVDTTLLSNSHFSFIQWRISVVYDSLIRLVHESIVNKTYRNCSSPSSCSFKLLYSLRQVEVIWWRDGTLYSGSSKYISLLKPVLSTAVIRHRLVAMNCAMAFVISPDR